MNGPITCAIAIALIAPVVMASAQPMPSQADIVAANDAYFSAFLKADVDTMAQYETADVAIIENGALARASSERLANIRKRGPIATRTQSLEVVSFRPLSADAALISGWVNIKLGAREGRTAFTERWNREGGRWKIAFGSYSRFIETAPPNAIPGAVRRDRIDPDLLAAIKRRDDAVKRSDGAAWSGEVTDRHINLPLNGAIRPRADRMAVISSAPPGSFEESEDEQFLVYGSSVVICIYVQGAGPTRARFAETWIREPGGWKLALRQATPL